MGLRPPGRWPAWPSWRCDSSSNAQALRGESFAATFLVMTSVFDMAACLWSIFRKSGHRVFERKCDKQECAPRRTAVNPARADLLSVKS